MAQHQLPLLKEAETNAKQEESTAGEVARKVVDAIPPKWRSWALVSILAPLYLLAGDKLRAIIKGPEEIARLEQKIEAIREQVEEIGRALGVREGPNSRPAIR